jgi:hypothetical protein
VVVEPDGTVTLEEDGVLVAEFASIFEAAHSLLEFENWAREQGSWAWPWPSFLDESHPLNPMIMAALN